MKLHGKLALVTGGTDGIGREIARQLKRAGAAVIVAGRNEGRLASARGEGFEAIQADLSTVAGCDTLSDLVRNRPIDLLINNAGIGAEYKVGEPIDTEAVDACVFLNLNAPMRLTAALLDTLRTRPEAAIVNVTSGLAIAPRAGSPVYCATKAGLRSFTQALRAQLAGTPVRVIEALPPVVETRMTAASPHRKMSAAECARQIVAAIAAGRTQANVGQVKLLNAVNNVAAPLARRIMLRY